MSYGAALSEHPLPAEATGEVVGSVLEQVGGEPDLAVLFVTPAFLGALDDIVGAVRQTLRPGVLLAVSASSVIGRDREVEDHPALALWAGHTGPAEPFQADAVRLTDGWTFTNLPEPSDRPSTMLLLADPFSFPVDAFLDQLAERSPALRVIGGLAGAGSAPGSNVLALDGMRRDDGAVGVVLRDPAAVTTVVSQGCRPVGSPLTVTRSERNVVYELAGRPALERLQDLLESFGEDELAMARQGLHIGRVIDEHKATFDRGDFLVRSVLGGDKEVGALAVGDDIAVGDTVQFQLRDAGSADEDLRLLLDGHTAGGALVFTCNGRGIRLFGRPDHDAEVVVQSLDTGAVAGMFCAGEIGPVGDRNFVHGFTASIALFR